MTPTELYNTFLEFVEKGDEEGARAFVIEHLNEFPEETREKLVFTFLVDAAISTGDQVAAVHSMQLEGKELLEEITKAEQVLDDVDAINTLKQS